MKNISKVFILMLRKRYFKLQFVLVIFKESIRLLQPSGKNSVDDFAFSMMT